MGSRALAVWLLAAQRNRSRAAGVNLAQVFYSQHVSTLAHIVLRSWHAHIDRVSCLVTPLSLRGSALGGSPLGSPIDSVPHYHSAITRSASAPNESPGPSSLQHSHPTSPSGIVSLR